MTMYCEYCHGNGYHHPQCPSYIAPLAKHCCSICEEGIYDGEEYIVNEDGDYAHLECFYGIKDLLRWLGVDINVMEDECERNY